MCRDAESNGRNTDQKNNLAVRVLEAGRNQLFFRYRYLERALFQLEWTCSKSFCFGCDGQRLYYSSSYVLKRYMQDSEEISLDYLHTVLHCLCQHPFFYQRNEGRREETDWNLAADIAVECLLEELTGGEEEDNSCLEDPDVRFHYAMEHTGENGKNFLGFADRKAEERRLKREIIRRLEAEIGILSAQKIYFYLQKHGMPCLDFPGKDFPELGELFRRDTHQPWYVDMDRGCEEERQISGNGKREHPDQGCGEERQNCRERDNGRESEGMGNWEIQPTRSFSQRVRESGSRGKLQQTWKDVAGQVWMEAKVLPVSSRGKMPGNLLHNLRKLTRENYDYTQFLTQFACRREERLITDEDEFDYIFYTYGLKLFGRVPLVEPLEYKEKRLVREFVIAIDTSGSCQGEPVESFLRKTYGILRQTDSFTARTQIRIIQCDAEIQEVTKIESRQELDTYIAGLTLKGFGGTDFTPVFAYVDQLIETGEIGRLDGLLYFTDGYGRFPAKPPGYQTAFVFLDREGEAKVPPWAMKVYLDS